MYDWRLSCDFGFVGFGLYCGFFRFDVGWSDSGFVVSFVDWFL